MSIDKQFPPVVMSFDTSLETPDLLTKTDLQLSISTKATFRPF